jgi:hypothetical protein
MDEHRLDSRSTGVGVQVAVAMRELQISAGSREGAGSVEGGVVLHEVLANDRSIAADTGSGHASPSHVMDGASLFTGPRSLGRVGEEAGCDDVRLKEESVRERVRKEMGGERGTLMRLSNVGPRELKKAMLEMEVLFEAPTVRQFLETAGSPIL